MPSPTGARSRRGDVIAAAFSGVDGLEAARLLIDDEGKFCDFATSRAFLTEERQII
jgi:hypothetical protein